MGRKHVLIVWTCLALAPLAGIASDDSVIPATLAALRDRGATVSTTTSEGETWHGLNLEGVQVSAGELAALNDVRSLRSLSIEKAPLGDAQLAAIGTLRQLKSLSLGDQCGLRDSNIDRIGALVTLRTLSIGDNPITKEGLRKLSALEDLENLLFWRTNLTDDDIAVLASLPRLHSISLVGTRITGTGFEGFNALQSLSTITAPTSGAGLQTLMGLPHLTGLQVLSAEDCSFDGFLRVKTFAPLKN